MGLALFALVQAVFFAVLLGMAALERRNVRTRSRQSTVVPAPVTTAEELSNVA